jgi:hypothetical protein
VTLEYEFAANSITPITTVTLTVTAPAIGAVPATTASGTGDFTIGAVTWDPVHNPFQEGVQYIVNITLTANTDYTFTGGLTTRTINGQTATIVSNTGTSAVLSHQFAVTSTWTAIAGGTGSNPVTVPGQSTFGINNIHGITYGNGMFIAVGMNGRMARSTNNGTTWIAITGGTGTTNVTVPGNSRFGENQIEDITYGYVNGNGRFVAVGWSGRMAWSDDGITWNAINSTQSTFGINNIISGVTYGNGRFVAVGGFGRMAWSDDGITWNSISGGTGNNPVIDPGQSTFGENPINSITYDNGIFIAGGGFGRMAWSDNGITWNAIPGGTGIPVTPGQSTFGRAYISGITYGNGRFVAVGEGGRMAWSNDGITWTAIPGGTGMNPVIDPGQSRFGENRINGITYGNGRFIAVGNQGRMARANWP